MHLPEAGLTAHSLCETNPVFRQSLAIQDVERDRGNRKRDAYQ
jgi:hypothetical protein